DTRVASGVAAYDVADDALVGPDTILAGWTTLRHAPGDVEGHNVVAIRLPDGVDAAALVAAFDTARAIPLGGVALGGTDARAEEVVVHLTPGRVVITCVSRSADGRRHGARGEWRAVSVVSRANGAPEPLAPQTTIDVEMGDFAFLTAEHWGAGERFVRVRNTGRQDHLLLLARLRDGKRLADAVEDDDAADPAIGVWRVGPGETAYLPVRLSPGRYILVCLVPDPASGRTHQELGMMREIQVVTLVAQPNG
ncbi:MAG TPA: hypothetical protein VFV33_00865, partial [Gemmatimonadaceae bacterium]|nr:hypothetical protein [Gemmatimonadaceae bacterium]